MIWATRIRFIGADPADQNGMDPNGSGSGSATLVLTIKTVFFRVARFSSLPGRVRSRPQGIDLLTTT